MDRLRLARTRLVERQSGRLASARAELVHVFSLPARSMQIRNSLVIIVRAHTLLITSLHIASNGNTLRGHQTEFRLLHVKRLISDYARVVIVARTTEWPLALADQGGPVDSTVQLL